MSEQARKLLTNVPSYSLLAHWRADSPNEDVVGELVEDSPNPELIYEVTLDHINTMIDEMRDAALRIIEWARVESETPERGYLGTDELEATYPTWMHSRADEIICAVYTYVDYCNDRIGDELATQN